MTLTITVDGKTWVSGKRGRVPNFVANHPDYIAYMSNKEVPQKSLVSTVEVTHQAWKWRGEVGNKPVEQCIVVASDARTALKYLNMTFKYPVTMRELSTLWAKVDTRNLFAHTEGVYQLQGESWVKRKEYNS